MTTGVKLAPAVRTIINTIRNVNDHALGERLRAGKRKFDILLPEKQKDKEKDKDKDEAEHEAEGKDKAGGKDKAEDKAEEKSGASGYSMDKAQTREESVPQEISQKRKILQEQIVQEKIIQKKIMKEKSEIGQKGGSSTDKAPDSPTRRIYAAFGVEWSPPSAQLVQSSPEQQTTPQAEPKAKPLSPVAAAASNHGALVFMDASQLRLCRMAKGTRTFASMEPGPQGLAIGTFPDGEQRTSDMPNGMLTTKKQAAIIKKPVMKTVKKVTKKAAMEPIIEPGAKYTVMFYKAHGAHALRISGGRQLFQVCTADPACGKNICEEAKSRLEAGAELEAVKTWAKSQALR